MLSDLTISATAVTELRARVAGTVCVRGDEGYQRLAAAWNLTARQAPAVVVAPSGASDVVQAVRIAGAEGLRVTVQTTGHGAAGLVGGDTLLPVPARGDGCLVARPDPATATALFQAAGIADRGAAHVRRVAPPRRGRCRGSDRRGADGPRR